MQAIHQPTASSAAQEFKMDGPVFSLFFFLNLIHIKKSKKTRANKTRKHSTMDNRAVGIATGAALASQQHRVCAMLSTYLSPGRRSAGRAGLAEVRAKCRGPRSSGMRSSSCQLLSNTKRCFSCPASPRDTAVPHQPHMSSFEHMPIKIRS